MTEHNPSGSHQEKPGISKRALVLMSGVALSVGLSACAGNGAPVGAEGPARPETTQSDTATTAESEQSIVDTPESDITTEAEQPQAEYKKPENRPDYKEVIKNWYAQDMKTIKEIGESDADEDLEKRAQFIAALYLEASNEDAYPVYGNNSISLRGIVTDVRYTDNPMLGANPLDANDNQLDAMLGAQELFPVVKVLDAFHNGEAEKVQEINGKTFRSLMGHTNPFPNPETLGFERARTHALAQNPNEEPTRPKTRTVRISDEDVAAIGILENGYKPPVSEKYPTFWVKSIRVDKPDEFALIRAVTVVPLSDAAGQIPDFDGNYYAYEDGEPVDMGHPKSEVKIPVVRVEYIVTQENLPDKLK